MKDIKIQKSADKEQNKKNDLLIPLSFSLNAILSLMPKDKIANTPELEKINKNLLATSELNSIFSNFITKTETNAIEIL